jgi:hypothetical protein
MMIKQAILLRRLLSKDQPLLLLGDNVFANYVDVMGIFPKHAVVAMELPRQSPPAMIKKRVTSFDRYLPLSPIQKTVRSLKLELPNVGGRLLRRLTC